MSQRFHSQELFLSGGGCCTFPLKYMLLRLLCASISCATSAATEFAIVFNA